jgi:hypothetical protein
MVIMAIMAYLQKRMERDIEWAAGFWTGFLRIASSLWMRLGMKIVQHALEKLANKGQQEACTMELTRVVVASSGPAQLVTVQGAIFVAMALPVMCVKMARIIPIDVKNALKSEAE